MIWKILEEFGLLSWMSDLLRNKSVEKPMTMDMQTESLTKENEPKILVHKITDGPYSSHEAGITFEEEGDPEFWYVEALVEYDGTMQELMITHQEFNKLYKILNHTRTHIEPYELGKD
jgi:hypothetical protein